MADDLPLEPLLDPTAVDEKAPLLLEGLEAALELKPKPWLVSAETTESITCRTGDGDAFAVPIDPCLLRTL